MASRVLLRRGISRAAASRRPRPGTSPFLSAATGSNALPVFQIHRSIATTTTDTDGNGLTDWIWRQVQVPKGFENFFPKGGGGGKKPDKKDSESSTSKEAKDKKSEEGADAASKESTGGGGKKGGASSEKEGTGQKKSGFGNFGQQAGKGYSGGGGGGGGGSSGGGGDPNNNSNQQLGGLTALAIMLAVATTMLGDEQIRESGREVTWSDFRNYMLEPGDVERIVVTNKNVAKVYLKPGARGVPVRHHGGRHGHGGELHQSPSPGGSDPLRRGADGGGGGGGVWDEQTSMDMEGGDQLTLGSSNHDRTAGASGGGGSHGHGHHPHQLVYHFSIGSVESFERKLEESQRELGIVPRDFVPVQYANETSWGVELLKAVPTMFLLGSLWYVMRNMGGAGGAGGGGGGLGNVFKIGKSNAKKIRKEDVDVTFKDVAGCNEAKKEIMEFVDFLQDNQRFTKLGAKIPKGALLCGPPGTGKTLLAKAVAGEANVPFFSISGSDFIEMFVGVGPSRVRDLFKEARAAAPCIVFIDEIDAVGRQRGRGGFSGGNDERENTLNQLLVEMDGFTPSSGVVVLAGTNRVDILDQALTRPGRFDRQILVDKPDLNGRKEIFEVHLKDITLEDDASDISGRLAGLTPGFTGADIANIANEAAIQAARRKGESVTMRDFEAAVDRIIGGLESGKLISKAELNIVAHHEAGHAVAGWFLEHADPLLKVTIVPRTSGALGFAQYLPKELFLRTEEQIMDIVCMALAGRAAEEVFFGKVTTGASDDLKRVTGMVYEMIQTYGMNDRVGQLAFVKDPNAFGDSKPYSDATAQAMDEEARRIVDEAYQRTLTLIRDKKEEVDKVAQLLLEKETINHDHIIDLIGERPFEGDDAYNEYVQRRREDKEKDKAKVEAKDAEEAAADDDSDGSSQLTPGLV